MPHVNLHGVDACVSLFVVYRKMCLLVYHKKIGCWLGVGGHWADTNKNETFDEALLRETEEEVGLKAENLTFLGQNDFVVPRFNLHTNHNHRNLLRPVAIDLHDFPPVPGHRHQALVYMATSDTCVIPPTAEYGAEGSHGWFGVDSLDDSRLETIDTIRWYAKRAIHLADEHQYRHTSPPLWSSAR